MSTPSVLLIGCGRMGRGITRMLLLEQQRQHFPFDLWIFDPNEKAEDQCLHEVQQSNVQGTLRSLREYFSSSDYSKIRQLQQTVETDKRAIRKASALISDPIQQIQPRLILNAATFFAQQMYIPLAQELACDYIDLGQNLPSVQDLSIQDAFLLKNQKGVRIIQESGLAPGLANILAVSMYEKALIGSTEKKIHSMQMRAGGLPQHSAKNGDLHYGPTFSPEGLLFEYTRIAYGLRNKQLVTPNTFSHPEYWEAPSDEPLPYGIQPFIITDTKLQSILSDRLEEKFLQWKNNQLLLKNIQARPTADGTSRMCFDQRYQSTVNHLEYKSLRYFPHYETWTKLQKTNRLTSTLERWTKHIDNPQISGYPDLVLLRVWAQTTPTSPPHSVEHITLHDDVPVGSPKGFTAMQHLTGWPTVLLTLALLQYPFSTNPSQRPEFFRSPDSTTAFGRTVEDVLQWGGIIAPFELIEGLTFLEKIAQKNRIPLSQTTLVSI